MEFTASGNRNNGSTKQFIYQTLREKIFKLELEPGVKMSEKEIAEQLKVSRTPVRESFLQLSQEGLLEIYPQKGTVVSRIDLAHVEESRFVRENIEKAIVRLACELLSEEDIFQLETNLVLQEKLVERGNYLKQFELDDEFHRIIFFGCDKKRTWEMVRQMNTHFNRLRMLRLTSPLDWSVILSQHKSILELIKQKEANKAEEVMSEHLQLVVIEQDYLKECYPTYFK
ncbi:GntR family transcriptional regulator [Metabacillus malikii]|uniref:DNA-binding GntR family transcriptional regulator n=1 Tax=Metabacillus malikii TaxID=1504265 RepID=A0ABT9ZDM5_9BACI|nr:GntR family transcriptional regulator [Metabacillus malikii]MDQ0229355.1 DNA-binding GntR family transcriptional regulator [Metabacillus malikii]